MTKTIFITDNKNEDEFEVMEHTDTDGNHSVALVLINFECKSERPLLLPLHRNAAIQLAMKIIETLK